MGPGGPEYYHDYKYYAWPGGPQAQAMKRGQAKPGTTTYYHDYGYYAWPGGAGSAGDKTWAGEAWHHHLLS